MIYFTNKGRYAISKDMVYLPLNYLWTDVDIFRKSKINFNIRKNFCKKTDVYIVWGELINISETFKINMYFDEKGEELERLIKYLIINTLKKNTFEH